ncbi:hypothetical protein RYA05_00240 [Pseudomonas syringae pv. actinidiae]|nr:hypothetical protein [Pseudomonas syringae pv. actinidiae]
MQSSLVNTKQLSSSDLQQRRISMIVLSNIAKSISHSLRFSDGDNAHQFQDRPAQASYEPGMKFRIYNRAGEITFDYLTVSGELAICVTTLLPHKANVVSNESPKVHRFFVDQAGDIIDRSDHCPRSIDSEDILEYIIDLVVMSLGSVD